MANPATIDIERIARENKVRLQTVINEIHQELALEVVQRTPVDTGFLRSGWTAHLNTLGSPRSDAEIEAERQPTTGENKFPPAPPIVRSRLSLAIAELSVGDTIFITNGVRYAIHVERGTSRSRGRFMVRSSVGMLPAIVDRAVQFIRSRR